MTKASDQNIALNEAIIAASSNPAAEQTAKENVDLWLSVAGLPGKYGTAYALAEPKAPVAPAAPTRSAPVVQAPAQAPEGKSARQEAWDDLFWQARLSGLDAKEATRLASNELARRNGEDPDIESMTAAEAEAHLKTFDPSVMGAPVFDAEQGEPPTEEQFAADLTALAESMSPKQPGIDMNEVHRKTAERQADKQAEHAREAAVKASMLANPHLSASQIESVIAPVSAFRVAPVVAPDPLAGFTPADMGLSDE